MNQNLEVIINQKGSKFIAKCNLFPSCIGTCTSKQGALKKLSSSISNYISKLIGATLDDVLSSENYTEILFDHTSKTSKQTLSFNIGSSSPSMIKNFLFKVSPIEQETINDSLFLSPIDISENETGAYPDLSLKEPMNDSLFQLFNQAKQNNEPGSYVFGFPLNFN